ncbi:hypothetical protein PVAP13_1KG522204 [Panicum virgatum]|uniref:Uncharacterized protein n=1 Tax=Panicum virgatum TaxID=38727 RepID=A0A8T0XVP5_PANVG|nr:hypothetical protein PVAP13_1KG522204 [Panicum virgatum]
MRAQLRRPPLLHPLLYRPPPPPPPLPTPPAQPPQLASPMLLRQLFPNLFVSSGEPAPSKNQESCFNLDTPPAPPNAKNDPIAQRQAHRVQPIPVPRQSESNRGRRTQSRHLVRNTSSTSRRDFVPSVTKPKDAASFASPTTIATQPAMNLFVASTASTPATGPVIVAAKPPPVIPHTCQTQHRESRTSTGFSTIRDNQVQGVIESTSILCNASCHSPSLRDEIQQIVASATLPLHARLSELQNKIHDWLKNTENYVLDRELQPEQREIHGTCAAFRESERFSREHDVVDISQAASGLLPAVPVHQVFNRLLQDMPSAETNFSSSPISHQDVEDAL